MRRRNKAGIPFWPIGGVIAFIGLILTLVGGSIDDDYSRHMEHIFEYGSRDSTGHTMTTIGIFMMILGLLLIAAGFIIFFVGKSPAYPYAPLQPNGMQPSIYGMHPVGVFQTTDNRYELRINANSTCEVSQDGRKFRGTVVQSQDGSGKWIVSISNYGPAYEFESSGTDLHVKGGPLDCVFYRRG